MIRNFFHDGMHWMVAVGVIIGYAIFGLYISPGAADFMAPTLTVEQQR